MSKNRTKNLGAIEEYEYLFRPYWATAYANSPGKPGFPMRLVQYLETREEAENELEQNTGRHSPPGCKIGLVDFIARYENGGLPITV